MTSITFHDLGLGAKVEAAVEAAGYTHPTPIQAAAIPVALQGRDILGVAQTGTGKTASFTLPMITRLERGRAKARMPRSLILAPTRELAAQVAESFEKYGVNHRLTLALLIGGVAFDEQIRKLDRGVDVLIATPGRLLDHFQRGRILLTGVEILVIDEADRMLDMGFIPDIEKICRLLPTRRQTLFFSATMPAEVQRLADQFLTDPERIEAAPPATTAKTITQCFFYVDTPEDWAKRDHLRNLIRSCAADLKNAIIFCNRKRDVAILHKSLCKHGFNAGALHGDMDQSSRTATLAAFRAGEITLLAASDVAARGLDIPDVSHVFNFDVPIVAEDYVHRIGRTGRAGRSGTSLTLVTIDDLRQLVEIGKLIGEDPVWLGDPPAQEDFDEAALKKRRRRGNRPSEPPQARTTGSPSRTRSSRGRPEASAETSGRNVSGEAVADVQGRRRSRSAIAPAPKAGGVAADEALSLARADSSAPESTPQAMAPSALPLALPPALPPALQSAPAPRLVAKEAVRGGDADDLDPIVPQAPVSAQRRRASSTMTEEQRVQKAEDTFKGHLPAFLQRPVRKAAKTDTAA